MKIALIGTGNVGSALASGWAKQGHEIYLGVRDLKNFKGKDLLKYEEVSVHTIPHAVEEAEVIVLAAAPVATKNIAEIMGDVQHKVIIDAMNSITSKPEPYSNSTTALIHWTNCPDIVKCFNTTGFENMSSPEYDGVGLDMFVAGDSLKGKQIAEQLSADLGFERCYDFGGSDKFDLLEQLALSWINLAIIQGEGRNIAFKVIHRR